MEQHGVRFLGLRFRQVNPAECNYSAGFFAFGDLCFEQNKCPSNMVRQPKPTNTDTDAAPSGEKSAQW